MALDLRDCSFFGPALPEPFVKFKLEGELNKRKLLPKSTGDEGKTNQASWEIYRRKLRALGEQGGDRRVTNHVLSPLIQRLGYETIERQGEVATREASEDGGWLFTAQDGTALRAWSVALGTDLDAPNRRGRAYRFSPSRVAQRVLLATGERVGLLTDGEELRLLLCDPARPDSHIAIRLDRSGGWRAAHRVPDSYRLLIALASPVGVGAAGELAEKARLVQSEVTKELRTQARQAVDGFLQGVLDHPDNADARAGWEDTDTIAKSLWREALILIYRLLFVFKLESSADPARAFSFAATSLWRNTYSPNTALAELVRKALDEGAETGGMLEGGLRTLFRIFAEGLDSSELHVSPLGGMLFGADTTPLLNSLQWGEPAVGHLLDALLWTAGDGKGERERVHYGALDVEDLGRVYEALLELEPGIAGEPMCRLRRGKFEVVVPAAQGDPYRGTTSAKGGKTQVKWVEDIPDGRLYLRVGLGRKASGSYYTPHPLVRFLVHETLGPQVAERSPSTDPRPGAILDLKVLDPAMGSGHFLVEACRYLGEALYEACRLCDEVALEAEDEAARTEDTENRARLEARASELRKRVEDLPDPDDELVAYLPSRVAEGEESGLSQNKALAMCRRLVAVHCLYGIDKNVLAVGLAKVSLWLESYSEGLPLTFLDHRLLAGDSLSGPRLSQLSERPSEPKPIQALFAQRLRERLSAQLQPALVHVAALEATIGTDVSDLARKDAAKRLLDESLRPLRTLAAAWSGAAMVGVSDQDYEKLADRIAAGEDPDPILLSTPSLRALVDRGLDSVAFELAFPEVFLGSAYGRERVGFDAVIGNPPWDVPSVGEIEYLGSLDIEVHRGGGARADRRVASLLADPAISARRDEVLSRSAENQRCTERASQDGRRIAELSGAFLNRSTELSGGALGFVVPSSLRRNETQSWLRRKLIENDRMGIQTIVGLLNKRRLFEELPVVLEFDLLVLGPRSTGQSFKCDFGVVSAERLFSREPSIDYPVDLVRNTNPGTFSIPEVSSSSDAAALKVLVSASDIRVGSWMNSVGLKLTQEVNYRALGPACLDISDIDVDPRDPAGLEMSLRDKDALPLLESKSIFQFDANWMGREGSAWDPVPSRALPLHPASRVLGEKVRQVKPRSGFYRIAMRQTCGSTQTNERSSVGCMICPGYSAFHSAIVESMPERATNFDRLLFLATINSFVFDAIVRPQIGANLSLFILESVPWPEPVAPDFLAHGALRLSCNHVGYERLWAEQVGGAWRESSPRRTWPVISNEPDRWTLRSALEATIASTFGLDRETFRHILGSFSHKSCADAANRCLAAFDDLQNIGLTALAKKYDPYSDIPRVNTLPKAHILDGAARSPRGMAITEGTLEMPLLKRPTDRESSE